MVELGPYAYRQKLKKTDVEFTSSDSVRYKEYRHFEFAPDLSNSSDSDIVIVPNIPLFGAMMTEDMEKPYAKEIFLNTINSYEFANDTKPFLRMTVKGKFHLID